MQTNRESKENRSATKSKNLQADTYNLIYDQKIIKSFSTFFEAYMYGSERFDSDHFIVEKAVNKY